MSGGGFVKLYGTILTSSIWLEDHTTFRVWIGMLALADANGYVGASVGGLAHACRVTRDECAAALDKFMSPDEESRTPDDEGRRVEKVDRGWRILNAQKYRDMRSPKQVADAERIREKRERGEYDSRGPVEQATDATSATRSNVALEVEVEVEEETTTTPPPLRAREPEKSEPGATAHPEQPTALEQLLARVPEPDTWRAEANACIAGMPGHEPATAEQVETAARDLLANGKTQRPSLRQWRRYIEGAARSPPSSPRCSNTRPSPMERSIAESAKLFEGLPE